MRTKRITMLLALVLCISAFTLPLTAYAASDKDTAPPKLTAVLDGDTLNIESSDDNSGVEAVYIDGNRVNSLTNGSASVALKDYAGSNKKVSVYAVDYAGNRSDTVKLDNPYYKEPVPTTKPTTEPTQSQSSNTGTQSGTQNTSNSSGSTGTSNQGTNIGTSTGTSGSSQEETTSSIPDGAFTPEGTGTVLDEATGEGDDKQFYTITTEEGNVFYLIIDGKRDANNVYFLNSVTEADLLALAEKDGTSVSAVPEVVTCNCTDKCESGKVNTSCPVCKNDLTGCTGKAAEVTAPEEPTEPAQPEKDNGSLGTILFTVIGMLAVGGIGYYVKIVRPKQQAADDDEDFEDDGYGEGFDPDAAYGDPEYLPDDEDGMNEDGE